MSKSIARKLVIRIVSEPPAHGPQDGEELPPNRQGEGIANAFGLLSGRGCGE
jgi:hypothetical protein